MPLTELDPIPSAEQSFEMGGDAYRAGRPNRCPKDAWTPHGGDVHFRNGWEAARTSYRRTVAKNLTVAIGDFLMEWAG